MPCIEFGNAIVCMPLIRKFRYKNKYYFVEESGVGRNISDEDGNGLFIEDFKKKMRSKMYKEIKKGLKRGIKC